MTHLVKSADEFPLGGEVWGNSSIVIPEEISGDRFSNIFTGETLNPVESNGKRVLAAGEVFDHFPLAMLERKTDSESMRGSYEAPL